MRRMGLHSLFAKFGGLCLLLSTILFACQTKPGEKLQSPAGYDFSQRVKKNFGDNLREISGIAWDHNKNIFAAIKDEKGTIYFLDKENQTVFDEQSFVGKGDFEDIVFVNSIPFILKSDGTIYKCNIDSAGQVSNTELGKVPIEGTNDFESLYFDPARRSLIALCKNCEVDEKKKISAFAFNLDSNQFLSQPVFQIDVDSIKSKEPKKGQRFQPSAAAIHPIQQKLYIISSASNQLAITDLNGNVENVYVLAANYFPQPEGICFKQGGDMYISNEGKIGAASLLYFRYIRKL